MGWRLKQKLKGKKCLFILLLFLVGLYLVDSVQSVLALQDQDRNSTSDFFVFKSVSSAFYFDLIF